MKEMFVLNGIKVLGTGVLVICMHGLRGVLKDKARKCTIYKKMLFFNVNLL